MLCFVGNCPLQLIWSWWLSHVICQTYSFPSSGTLNIDILIEGVKKFLWNPSVKEGEEGGTPQIHKLVFGLQTGGYPFYGRMP